MYEACAGNGVGGVGAIECVVRWVEVTRVGSVVGPSSGPVFRGGPMSPFSARL